MSHPMKVLVAYDGSACSEHAIEDLSRAGLPDNVEAIVLSVADTWALPKNETVAPAPLGPSATIREAQRTASQMQERARLLAETGAERLRQRFPAWHVTAETATNSPAWAIILRAEEWDADLIVVGSHGYSALNRWVLGSVSQSVLTHARTPVRIARARPTPANRPLRILVGVDGSLESDLAVRTVARRHWPVGTDIHLALVLNPSMLEAVNETWQARTEALATHPELSGPLSTAVIENDVEEIDGLIGRMFESYTAILHNQPGISVSTAIHAGDPKRVLLQEAENWGADCIFLGSRGLSRWERLLLGSVSSAVATRAYCPVEVVRRPDDHPDHTHTVR